MSRATLEALSGQRRAATLSTGLAVRLAYKPDVARADRQRFAPPARMSGLPPRSTDLRSVAPAVLTQICSSCTGHAMAMALATAFMAAGRPFGFLPSPAEIYRLARALEHDGHPANRLPDNGAYPALVVDAINRFGVRPTRALDGVSSDDNEATVTDPPTLMDLEAARHHRPVNDPQIVDCSMGRDVQAVIADIVASLAAGRPVTFGTFVDTAFMNWTPAKGPIGACNTSDPSGGGHAICVLGHRTEPASGAISLLVRNSWGASWGEAGNIWCAPANVQQWTDIRSISPQEAA